MKKILYITLCDIRQKDGVSKKINSQINSFRQIGNEINCVFTSKSNIYFQTKDDLTMLKQCDNNLKKRFNLNDEIYKILNNTQIDIIYIRYYKCDFSFLCLLKKIKQMSKKTCVLLEIPTYPYDGEISRAFNVQYLLSLLDRILRGYLKYYIDYIVTFSLDSKIYNIPCINIANAIDLKEVNLVDKKDVVKSNIVFTSVSSCCLGHGVDRFLLSLDNYKIKNIKFNIVGIGPETDNLKKIISKSSYLQECVSLLGFKNTKQLENIYNETDIAVGSLGRYRQGIMSLRSLKTIEYTAKGLPSIFSEHDPGFTNAPFVFKVQHDDTLINIIELLEWYKNLKLTSEEIREYSKEFSMESQMKKVIDSISL